MRQERGEQIRRFILEHEKRFAGFGSVCKMMVKCGKPNCRCAEGKKHGPYYCLYWREDGKAKRKYLGGPEEAEVARQTLLEIRRKMWRGYDHVWLYRRSLMRGLGFCSALAEFIGDPTSKNLGRMTRLSQELDAIRGGKLRGTTKRERQRKASEDKPKKQEPKDDELTHSALEAHAQRLGKGFIRAMDW